MSASLGLGSVGNLQTGSFTTQDTPSQYGNFVLRHFVSTITGDTFTRTGIITYTLDNDNADVDALNDGETLTDTFTVDATQTSGPMAGAVSATITITIRGATDGPPPTFGSATIPNQTYTQGTAIPDLTLPAVTVGTGTTPLAYTLSVPTGPFNFAGLTFDAAPDTRVLQGTPTRRQGAFVTYTVTDAAGRTATIRFTINVQSVFSFQASTIPPQTYTVGTPVAFTLPVATGGTAPLTYTLMRSTLPRLPDGLSFNGTTRVLSGTPTTAQSVIFYAYNVTDSTGLMGLGPALQITIREPPVTFAATIADQTYLPDTAVSVTLPTATGGDGALTYAITETLPDGLTFTAATRVLDGTPTTEQRAVPYTYTATDSGTDTARLTFTITIADDPPVIVLAAGTRMTVDEGATVTLDATGSSDPAGQPLTFLWAQDAADEVPVTLSDRTAAAPTFTAPEERTTLNFDLTVTDETGQPTMARLTVQVGRNSSERVLEKTLAAFGRAFASGTVGVFEDYLSTPAGRANTSHFTIGGHKFELATTTPAQTLDSRVASVRKPLTRQRTLTLENDGSVVNTPSASYPQKYKSPSVSFPNDRKTGSDSDHVFHRIGNPVEHDLADTINSANLADTTSNGATTGTPTPVTTTLMSPRDLLMKSAFHLNLNNAAPGTPNWSLWARATTSNFDGKPENDFEQDGDVTSAYLGADYRTPNGTRLGLAISESNGEIDYDDQADDIQGDLDADLTSILPYIQWQPTDTSNAWVVLGYGEGDAELATDGDAETTDVDIEMQMIAAGVSGDLTTYKRSEWSWKASAFAVELESDKNEETDLPAVTADSQRLRFAIQGRAPGTPSPNGARFTPNWELGLRWDDGDAEQGSGADLGLGFDYRHPASGLSMQAKANALLVHEENDYEEWNASLQVRFDPGTQGRGITFTLEPGWTADGRSQKMGMDFSNALGKWTKRGLRLELTGERTKQDDNDIGHNIRLTGSLRF